MAVFVKTLVLVMLLQAASCLPPSAHSQQKEGGELQEHEASYIIHEQRKELKSLQCIPKPAVVKIADNLEYHDALKDEEYFPKVVVVNRCLEDCTFCGDAHMGIPKGSCQPDERAIEKRSIIAFYYKEGRKKFQEVLIPEHTACRCSK